MFTQINHSLKMVLHKQAFGFLGIMTTIHFIDCYITALFFICMIVAIKPNLT